MNEFLTAAELKALAKVIAQARAEPGVHREPTPDGEMLAYWYIGEIRWFANSAMANLANGTVPLKERKVLS